VAAAGDTDELEALGERALVRQVVERREQLAVRQVPRRPEDHQGGRMDGKPLEPFDQRVLDLTLVRYGGAHRRGCPH
jgi:hypothetical protein